MESSHWCLASECNSEKLVGWFQLQNNTIYILKNKRKLGVYLAKYWADMVLFGLFGLPFKVLKPLSLKVEVFVPLMFCSPFQCFVLLFNRRGSHNPPLLGVQHPRWQTAWCRCLALIPFVMAQAHSQHILSSLGFLS